MYATSVLLLPPWVVLWFYDSHSSPAIGYTTQLMPIHFWQISRNKVSSSFSLPICETAYPVFTQFSIHYIKIILTQSKNFPGCSLHPLPLVLSLHTSDKSLALPSPHPHSTCRQQWVCTPLSPFPKHLILRLNKPSYLSLPSYIMGSKPSDILVGLHWFCPSELLALLS